MCFLVQHSHSVGTTGLCQSERSLTFGKGMAKAVADVDNPDEKQGGFASDDSNITGFSHMHDDGTGGVCSRNSRGIIF